MEPVRAETLLRPPYDGNVANLLARPVEAFPDRVALAHRQGERTETRTYRGFADRVGAIAGGLRERGFDPGDRLGVYLPNGVAFCEVLWACVRAGVVASPLNPQYRRRELEYQLDHADARAVVTDGDGADRVAPVAEDLGVEVVSTDPGAFTTLDDLAAGGSVAPVERDGDDVLLQPYTSGTTGDPKGVLLTHRNFRVQLVTAVANYTAGRVRGDELVVFPMYHITGTVVMMGALCTGRTVRLLRPDQWDPELVLETLAEHDVPVFRGVATMFADLLEAYDPDEHDLETLRRAGQGGDKLPEPVHEAFEERFDVAVGEGYGLTETTAGTHAIRASTLGDKVGSVGQPFGHTDSKIVDANSEEVPVGETGELLVRGPQVMRGYYDDPEATDEAFTEDGWFRTGDVAYRDGDNYYYVEGRESEMIVTAGYNVAPSEVERVLYDHPAVHEAAVFGVPDDRRGETVAAAVELAPDAAATGADLREFVLGELAPYKHPREVFVLPELPRTGSGKVRKTELRERFGTADGGGDGDDGE